MAILSAKRQVTLPKEMCDRLQLAPGDHIEFLEHRGRITIVKKRTGASDGVLRHAKPDVRYSEEDSLRDGIERQRRPHTKRRAA